MIDRVYQIYRDEGIDRGFKQPMCVDDFVYFATTINSQDFEK